MAFQIKVPKPLLADDKQVDMDGVDGKAHEYRMASLYSEFVSKALQVNDKAEASLLGIIDSMVDERLPDDAYIEQVEFVGDAIIQFLAVIGVSKSAINDLFSSDDKIEYMEMLSLAEMLGDDAGSDIYSYVAKKMNKDAVEMDSVYLDSLQMMSMSQCLDGLGIESAMEEDSQCECNGGDEGCECSDKVSMDDVTYPTEAQCKAGRPTGKKVAKGTHQSCKAGATSTSPKIVFWRRIKEGRKGVNKPTAAEKAVLVKMNQASKTGSAKKARAIAIKRRAKLFKGKE